MTREQVRARIEDVGIVPALRVSSADDAIFAAECISSSGINIVEVTMTVPGALGVISELTRRFPDLIAGAGTVWTVDVARQCLDAGAKFLTSTGFDPAVVELALKHDVAAFPGALTPTEVMTAWKAGADFVKVFPCAPVGGPQYIRALRAPFPEVRLIASGGVNQLTAGDFILAGATALGIGKDLIPHQAIARRQPHRIQELGRRFVAMVNEARSQKVG
jgi:2-dehydro-3-deoxyphosphogluconate aldolase/(4S)-4-hydroxy-2-oxoglutarate aldolase